MIIRVVLTSICAFAALAACDGPAHLSGLSEPALVETHEKAPPGAPEGSCWGKDVTPAVIETVTDRILVQPAEVQDDGTVLSQPIYKLDTRQAIVKERRELWFETPCKDQLTPDFLASLQRALQARGHYHGAVTGEMNTRTQRAIRRYQAPQGLDSSILSLSAARKLGLVAVDRPDEG
jgi:hypothetical protein